MNHLKYSKIEAFVFKLWNREVSDENLLEKEAQSLEMWKNQATKELDPTHIQESKTRVLQRLEPYFISLQPQKAIAIHYFQKHLYQAAAIILLLLTAGGFFTYNIISKADVYVAVTSNRNIVLEDGSEVTLLPGAKLTVEKSFPADTRIVSLEGDAIFKVTKSKKHPFIVCADGFDTMVLGTVFKISQSGKNKSVDLYEGKVAVSSSTGVPISYLTPHQQWTNYGVSRVTAVLTHKKDGNTGKSVPVLLALTFNDVLFQEVTEVLQKHYNIKIKYPQVLTDKKITADFTGGSQQENIEAVAFILGLKVSQENTSTYILKK